MMTLCFVAYSQSNIPVSIDNKCMNRNAEIFSRALIGTFGLDTVKMWIDNKYKFTCFVSVDSLGYAKKHVALKRDRRNSWFGEYRRKKIERYLIHNKINFEFCGPEGEWKDYKQAVSTIQQSVIYNCENFGRYSLMFPFPGELTRVPLPLPPDYKDYEKLSPFEIFCKRLNIKFEE